MTNDENPALGDDPRQWDAAYVLGSLSPAERLEYEAYLDEHPAAQADAAELAGLPGLLRGLSTAEALALLDDDEPEADVASGSRALTGPGTVQSIASRLNSRRRRRRAGLLLVAAVSALLLVAGGFAWGGSRAEAPGSEPLAAMTPAQGSSLTADIGLVSQRWGTRLDWHCDYATAWTTGSGSYDLVVTDDSGTRTTVATWQAIGGKATDLTASTAIASDSIRSVAITVSGQETALATLRL